MVSRTTKLALWWRNTGFGVRAAVFAVGCALLALLLYVPRPQQDFAYFSSNLMLFSLVNLNVLLLLVLIFVVGRNVIKLIFDRRRRILGSKLRLRLVTAFVGLTLVPTVILFILASDLLSQAIEGWFSDQVEEAFEESVGIGRQYYKLLRKTVRGAARDLSSDMARRPLIHGTPELLQRFLDEVRQEHELFSITIFDAAQQEVARSQTAVAGIDGFAEPPSDSAAAAKVLRGASSVLFERQGAGQFLRVYYPGHLQDQPVLLRVSYRLSADVAQALTTVSDSYTQYAQLKLFKAPFRSQYLLTLSLMTVSILFGAIWIGFYIARELSGPILRLAEGTRAVARGNYDFQLKELGDDEIAQLVKSFNVMINDIKASRSELEQRRIYIETILSNLAVGVVVVDEAGRVTLLNAAAAELFGPATEADYAGRHLAEVLPVALEKEVAELLRAAGAGSDRRRRERELTLERPDGPRTLSCTAGSLGDSHQRKLGAVLLFDDITDLVRAQQMAAWREVARRIAHEIKNPLTPIKLSAQRLRRLLGGHSANQAVQECTDTIVQHVDSIKRLANEFSNFARMPTIEYQPSNLNFLVADTLAPFAADHPEVVFQFIADNKIPELQLDREQIRRLLINLINNGLAAVVDQEYAGEERPCITLKSSWIPAAGVARLEVADNGRGVVVADKQRIFEPYYTTKQHGTGLGLAIVSSIVSDHHGIITVGDNSPRGTRFVVELPVPIPPDEV